MNRVFIRGDLHGEIKELSKLNKIAEEGDYVIILGDVGILWANEPTKEEKWWINWLSQKPWTTLFILGNHENYDRWDAIPVEEWHGGKVQKLADNIIRLCYGEIFDICGSSFFVVSGARSHDIQHGIIDPADYKTKEEMVKACKDLEKKHGGWRTTMYRIKGVSWWPQEVPSRRKREYAIENLQKANYKVDYILSHELPSSDVILLSHGTYKPDEYSRWLENYIRQKTNYVKWFGGHYHMNTPINDKDMVLYDQFEMLLRTGEGYECF